VVKSEYQGGSPVSEEAASGGFRARGEEALGDLAQALLENPVINQALTAALGAGERAAHAQRTAMGALNIPAASELERLEQRLRSLSNRLESVEDRLDDARDEVAALRRRLSVPEPGPSQSAGHVSVPERGESLDG
jgi:chromosome segregation ATPase